MIMNRLLRPVSWFVVLCVSTTAFAQLPLPKSTIDKTRLVLTSPPAEVFQQSEKAARAVEEVTRALTSILRDASEEVGVRSRAIRELSRFQTGDAIDALVDNLLFIDPDINEPGPLASFPAARALTLYGRRVYSAIWVVAAHERPNDYLNVLAFVLQAMDGQEVAIFRVKEQSELPSTTAIQAKQLKHVIGLLRQLDLDDPHQWPKAAEIQRNLEAGQRR
jgi:hypothetical protein